MVHLVSSHPVAPAEEGRPADPRRWWALGVICLALFIGQVDVTIVNVALPAIGSDLDATTSDLQWVMDAYSLVLAGFILLAGGLADRYGRKGAFIGGLVLFGGASVAAVMATDPWQLIGARAAMGVGAALFLAPALSLLTVVFPAEEQGRAVGIWAAVGGAGTTLGPVLGGVLLERFWWGVVLLVNVPVALVGIVGAVVLLPRSRRPGEVPLDLVGALLSVVGLGSLVFGLIEGPQRGWTSPLILGALLLGGAVVAVFVAWELHHDDPMVDVRILGRRVVAGSALAITTAVVAMTALLFLVPQLLQSVQGESALLVGLLLIPFGLSFAVLSPTSAGAVARVGARPVVALGLAVDAVGLAVLSAAGGSHSTALVLAGSALFGIGAAYAVTPATSAVLAALPGAKAGDGSALNQITRQVGAVLGVAVAGTVLAIVYTQDLAPALTSLPAADAALADASIGGAQQVAADGVSGSAGLGTASDAAFVAGYRAALRVIAGLLALSAIVVAVALPRTDRRGSATTG